MPFSHHSHSGQFCQHATGMLEEIIQEAIKKKFIVYGLSEHCPRYRIEDLYPEESHLQPLDLSKTFEEFFFNSEVLDLIEKYSLDYVVGSVHHVYETPIDFDLEMFEIALSKSSSINNALKIIQKKIYSQRFIDLNFIFSDLIWKKVERNIDYVVNYGGLFEINSAGFKVGLPDAYPQRDILQLILKKGGKCTISDDAMVY
ncbi:unnamed protein product [Rhizophagus irregularis]|nr:unnamed protein product [Rhizophagus irregularis]